MESLVNFANNINNFSFRDYCSAGSAQTATIFNLILGTIVWILSKTTGDYSWVDRIWSWIPIVYAGHILYHQDQCDHIQISTRQLVMFSLISLWGIRLTYNFYRKGGYSKTFEDYRWQYIRKHYPRLQVQLLNFFFISYYQFILIYWFTSPISSSIHKQFNNIDIILTIVWVLLFLGETIADRQQWEFQKKKYQLLKANGNKISNIPYPYKHGFIQDGLFKYSRHPNFICQISMWWVIFFFSVNSHGLNWTGLGALLLNLLFIGSTGLTQKISAQKYPDYKQYQEKASMLIPFFPSKKKSQ